MDLFKSLFYQYFSAWHESCVIPRTNCGEILMHVARLPSSRWLPAGLVAGLVAGVLLLPWSVQASGARQGVKQKPGELVVLRDVSARHAHRAAPPGMALIVNPSPRSEIDAMLGTGELSDQEYAAIGAGTATGAAPVTTVGRVTDRALGGALGGLASGNGTLSGSGINQALGVPMGAVGNATRGVGDQVRGALAQFPLMSPPATTPPPGG